MGEPLVTSAIFFIATSLDDLDASATPGGIKRDRYTVRNFQFAIKSEMYSGVGTEPNLDLNFGKYMIWLVVLVRKR
jgi:hypothetical protein